MSNAIGMQTVSPSVVTEFAAKTKCAVTHAPTHDLCCNSAWLTKIVTQGVAVPAPKTFSVATQAIATK